MKKLQRCAALAAAFCLLAGCAGEPYPTPDYTFQDHTAPNEDKYVTQLADLSLLKEGQPVLAVKERASSYHGEAALTKEPSFGYDFRYCDVSELDLSGIDLWQSSFSSSTVWPDQLPEGFSPEDILEEGKDPGLGIRALHQQGIDGTGVSIAIIDQALLTGHEQYKDNLMLYERIHCRGEEADLHGAAVASLAVGKDTGVAPGAKLYYIASTFGHDGDNGYQFDASILADCIDRVVEINQELPDGEKIRVISVSKGFNEQDEGYDRMMEAIAHAEKEGIFVLTTSPRQYASFGLLGLDRDVMRDPDDLDAYHLSAWVSENNYEGLAAQKHMLLVPSGGRTYASFTGVNEYEYSYTGGLSWGVPWMAGFYALCCQVDPDLTPERFIEAAEQAGKTIEAEANGTTYSVGKVVDPAGTIALLRQT